MSEKMMHAIVVEEFGGQENFQYKEIPEPVAAADQVLVKLEAIGVNPNESYVLSGNYNLYIPELPFIPGFDGAGIVEAVGTEVTDFKPGDRVYLGTFRKPEQSGTYAEKIAVDTDLVYHLPEAASFETGAALGIPAYTAYYALFLRANLRAGETVLVHGATGGVGSLVVQMAKAIGATVIGTSSNEAGRQSILDMGADHAMAHLQADNLDELADLTAGKGPDVIIEFLANENLETDLNAVAKGGRITIIGARDSAEISPRLIFSKDLTINGVAGPNMTLADYHEVTAGIEALLRTGAVKAVIGDRVPLKEAKSVHDTLLTKSGNGKSILIP